jgi:hypothetical protein
MRFLIGVLISFEALFTGVWVAGHLTTLGMYPAPTIAIVAVRGLVGALQFAAGSMLMTRHPAGPAFARVGFGASAVLLWIVIGTRLSPTSLFPTYRVPFMAAYTVYAAGVIWLLRRSTPR